MESSTPCDPANDVNQLQNWVDKYTIELKDKSQQLIDLKMLLGQIDGAVEQYTAAYDGLLKSKTDAACFQTKQQNAVDVELDESTRAQVTGCVDSFRDDIKTMEDAIKVAEEQLQAAREDLLKKEKGEQGLESAIAAFKSAKARAAHLDKAFTKELKDIEKKIDESDCDFRRMHYLLQDYDEVFGPVCKKIVSADNYRNQLYRAWCDVRDAQQKVTEAKVFVKDKEKALQKATDALKEARARRDQAIMHCISVILACGQTQDPDQTQTQTEQSQTAS